MDIADLDRDTDAKLETIKAKMRQLNPLLLKRFESLEEMKNLLAAGDIWITSADDGMVHKMQIDGTTDEVNSLEPLDKKWEAFGWNVLSVNGHSTEEISEAIEKAQTVKNKPSMIILNTIKGKGAFFAEGKVSSHNMNISEEQWKKAVCDLNGSEVK